jgi:hypothetical protein
MQRAIIDDDAFYLALGDVRLNPVDLVDVGKVGTTFLLPAALVLFILSYALRLVKRLAAPISTHRTPLAAWRRDQAVSPLL